MSVILELSLGDVTRLPKFVKTLTESFLKLCKIKYYNYSPVSSVQKNFSFQTGDPLGPWSKESDGGSSIWGILHGSSKRTYTAEFNKRLKHTERGTVSMATAPGSRDPEQREVGSQFLITLGDGLDYLDGKALVFGKVVEGFDTLEKINNAFCDEKDRPLQDIRVRHTIILDDPFPDPDDLIIPPESPVPTPAQLATVRIADDEDLGEDMDEEAMDKLRRDREAKAQALTLEMLGDLPFAEVKPPENILFVCKLNPVTQDEDLDLIFSRFGKILSCEVIRDRKTGDSLQYAFIEFEEQKDCEQAYFKMQGVLIDDHRIHVDFSQSVSRLSDTWRTATNKKRSHGKGGFGGIAELEKRKQYRGADSGEKYERGYGMVFDRDDIRKSKKTESLGTRDRSRSPSRTTNDSKGYRDRDRVYTVPSKGKAPGRMYRD